MLTSTENSHTNSAINLKKLGRNIALIRKNQKMSRYKLALEIFSGVTNLANIENGTANPTITTLLKISTTLKCEVKDFFDF